MRSEKIFQRVTANLIIVIALAVLFTVCCVTGSVNVVSDAMAEPYYRGSGRENTVSLMFNVYWGTEYVEPIMSVLEKYGVRATFFVGGSWADDNNAILRSIAERGHELGNHGYFHKNMSELTERKNREEIAATHNLVKVIAGVEMNLFAPPSGDFSDTTLEVAKSLGYEVILWSRDTVDWRDKNEELIFKRATDGVKGGDLILAHPTENTLISLPRILKYYQNNDLKQVVVSENISSEIL